MGFLPSIPISPQGARELFGKFLQVVFKIFNSTFDFKISLGRKENWNLDNRTTNGTEKKWSEQWGGLIIESKCRVKLEHQTVTILS